MIALSLAILLLLVSGFVSASEVAFFSLTPGDINDIREENAPSDPLIQRLLDRSEYLLAAILIANNFVNVAVVMLCTYGINAIVNFSSAPMLGFILETIVLTFLLLLFGEIMPKIYAQKNSLRFVRSSAPVLNVVERICRPLSKILVTSTSVINKALVKKKYDLSVDELSKALELTSTEMPEEKEMLSEIIKFYNKTADEIATDMAGILNFIDTSTKSIEHPDSWVMPSDLFTSLNLKRIEGTDQSVLSYIKEHTPQIKNWETATELSKNNKDYNSTGKNIGLLYTKDAEKMAHEAPMPFMQHAPQERNLEVVINCEGRDAGMQIIYPFSACLVYGL